jgi:hypothetical protein
VKNSSVSKKILLNIRAQEIVVDLADAIYRKSIWDMAVRERVESL